MTWLLTILSIIGVILNIRHNRGCFFIWAFTNASWAVVDYQKEIYSQSALFALYFILSLWGIREWKKKRGAA